jgi:starch synthase
VRILFVASECYPLIKTGGLADVVGALPGALVGRGHDVRVLLPAYPSVLKALPGAEMVAPLPELFGGGGRLLYGKAGEGLEVQAIDAPHLFDRPGNPYVNAAGKDWPDNHLRFGALSWVGSEVALGRCGDWRPDLVHAHDWQAGLTPAYLALSGQPAPPAVFTIHNLAFQGVFAPTMLHALRLPARAFAVDGVEFHGKISFMKAGLYYADHITTVSPTYAWEIQTPEHGMGLDGLLRLRAGSLTGILNGIDEEVWDPVTDTALEQTYAARHLTDKAVNKAALQTRFALDPRASAPLFCVISRLTAQKGLDLLLEAVPDLVANGGQLALLGSGEAGLESGFRKAADAHPGRVGVVVGYDEPLAHRMQAGADAIIIPSRFEPCGLTQLYGLRYGTLPVVARVGGLADTVIDANEAAVRAGVATGFQFAPVTADALRHTVRRAIGLYADRRRWRAMQRRAMASEVGWSGPSADYAKLYKKLTLSHPFKSSI